MPVDTVRAPGHSRERSLGWLATRWVEHFCIHGPGDIMGTPMRGPGAIPLSTELTALNVDAYAIDEDGHRLYDSVFYSRPKGADKSGHSARLALFEAMGPCRFAGWAEGGETYEQHDFRYVYSRGEAMGHPVTYPFLRILATEEGQTGNVYDAIHYILLEGPLREAFPKKEDVGLTRVYLPSSGEIRPSTASSSAKDGGKETFVVFDETHLYVMPELRRMYQTVRRNMAKRAEAEPWSLETSTMYAPGMNSIAEQSHDLAKAIQQKKVKRSRLLFDHRQAPADVDLANEKSLRAGLIEAYGDAADYMPIDRMISEIWDSRNDVADSRRYFLNQATAFADAWITQQEWDSLAAPEKVVEDGAQITLGFDGSKSGDWTALVGMDVESSHVFLLGVWDPSQEPDGEIDRRKVDAAVAQAFERYDVVGFYADVHPFESYIDAWEETYRETLCVSARPGRPIGWDMRGRPSEQEQQGGGQKAVTRDIEAFHVAILERAFSHDGDAVLRDHATNARNRPNNHGMSFTKERPGSDRKIDALAAAFLARQCRQDYTALAANKQRHKSAGWIVR